MTPPERSSLRETAEKLAWDVCKELFVEMSNEPQTAYDKLICENSKPVIADALESFAREAVKEVKAENIRLEQELHDTNRKFHELIPKMVFAVYQDDTYPPRLQSIFRLRKDADEFALTIKEGIVEELEVIE